MDPLEIFFNWFTTQGRGVGYVPLLEAVADANGVTSIVWYRQPPFQVQLFAVMPRFIIPEHHHPNVDSFELYVGGQIMFSHSGKWVTEQAAVATPADRGVTPGAGSYLRVKPDDTHGGAFGPSGGVFFSVQHWLNNTPPSCVSKDYAGIAVNSWHKTTGGKLEFKPDLSWRDAASLEDQPPIWIQANGQSTALT